MEQDIMLFFEAAQAPREPELVQDRATASALVKELTEEKCSNEQGGVLAHFITRVMNQIPLLLNISETKTVDDRVVRAAAVSLLPKLADAPPQCDHKVLINMCDRVIRGRAPNNRVTNSASKVLASSLLTLLSWGTQLTPASVTQGYRQATFEAGVTAAG